jgi:hypothetical protein
MIENSENSNPNLSNINSKTSNEELKFNSIADNYSFN